MYLAVVIGLVTRKPIGWAMSLALDSQLTEKYYQWLLNQEVSLKHPSRSDQGSHYTIRQYHQLLWCYQLKKTS